MSLVNRLLQYNASAPRYTSYPPANHFAAASDDSLVEPLWRASNELSPRNLSFYFHVPFCPKRCHFCGCHSEVTGTADAVERYFEALYLEMELRLGFIDAKRPLTQVHFGGGTPNAVPTRYLAGCLDRLFARFTAAPGAEIAIECNPAHLSFARLRDIAAAGFNRISLGIQDFDRNVLAMVGRDPCAYDIAEMIDDCRRAGLQGVNLDLLYGLPGQDLDKFLQTVDRTVALGPDRVALFSYAHVPWVKENQKNLDEALLPGPETKVEMFLAARERFLAGGFLWVGMDHFVKATDPLGAAASQGSLHRNFQGYCDRTTTGQVYGFGCSSITQLDNAYIQNIHASRDYTERMLTGKSVSVRCHVLTPDEKILRDAIADFMCNCRLRYTDELARASEGGWERLCALQDEGLLEIKGNEVVASDVGRLVIRYLAMQLDPLMRKTTSQAYSKTL